MEIKMEHIIVIVLIIVAIGVVFRQTSENFNVIENRWAFPLTNEAGNLWIKEFDRPGYYTLPDGRFSYVKVDEEPIPKSVYKEQVYDATFETPQFNYAGMPVPKHNVGPSLIEETEGNFEKGPSCKRMNASDSQQPQPQRPMNNSEIKKQMIENMENVTSEMNRNGIFVKVGTNNMLSLLFIVLVAGLVYYYYSKKQ